MISMEREGYERYGSGSKWIRHKDDFGNSIAAAMSPREEGLKLLRQMKALREDNPNQLDDIATRCGRWVLVYTYGDEPYGVSETNRLKSQLTAMNIDVKKLREFTPPPPKPMDGNKLLYKLKGLKVDQRDDFMLLVESHTWLAERIGGTESFTEDEVKALLATLDEMGVDAKELRELRPEMDGGKLLHKLRGYSLDKKDDYAAVAKQHPWLDERLTSNVALVDDEVDAVMATLADLKVDVKALREQKPIRVRTLPMQAPLPPERKTRLVTPGQPAKGGRWGKAVTPAETPVQAPDEAPVDTQDATPVETTPETVDDVPTPVDTPEASPEATPAVATKGKGGKGKKGRWAAAREANDRITLPTRTQPVTVPDDADGGTSAQIFRKVVGFANDKPTTARFGKLVRRIATTSIPDLAIDMMVHGAFNGLNSYRAGEELEERLNGLAGWSNGDIAALLTALKVDPMDMLRLFTRDNSNPADI